MKVLVTSSTGLTGRAVVKALAAKHIDIRAMIHSAKKSDKMLSLGVSEVVIGDIASATDLHACLNGVDAIYYICPTAREDEAEIGKMAISTAKEMGIKRFVYQSVLHSIEPELPHHRQKLEVERALIDSGLSYSIVQPAPFMQNILNAKAALLNDKVFIQKFFTSLDCPNRINLIDAEDFGQCVAEIIADRRYEYSTLELCGPGNLSVNEMLSAMESVTGSPVSLVYITDAQLRKSMEARNATEYSIDTLLRMFHHYNDGDFCGSDFACSTILQRKPTSFTHFLTRELK